MNTSEHTGAIAAALYAVQRDLELPRTDTKGQVKGNREYRYLSLPALIDHAHKALVSAQVQVIQQVTGGQGFVEVTTTLMHLTGEYVEVGPCFMPASGDAQAYGSAITYARRYALAAALNLVAEKDDDGAAASKRGPDAAKGVAVSGPPPSDDVAPTIPVEGDLDGPATTDQWDRLRGMAGTTRAATNRINKANKTAYTDETAEAGATVGELIKAMLLGAEG